MTTIYKITFLCFFLFFIPAQFTFAQTGSDYFFYSKGKKVHLSPSKDRLAIRYKKTVSSNAIQQKLAANPSLNKLSVKKRISNFRLTILESKQEKLNEKDLKQRLKGLRAGRDVELAVPVFEFPDADLIATDQFVVKLKDGYTLADLKSLNKEHGARILRKNRWLNKTYVLEVKSNSALSALEAANMYSQNSIVEYSQPNFIRQFKKFAVPNDPLFAQNQWNLNNTGQSAWTPDADMDAVEAWDLAGQNDVTIAIIDEGVDVDHVDLTNKMVAGYDATNIAPPEGVPGNAAQTDAHGTACAGIAAATTNNNEGVAGVSWSAKIMPVRVAYDSGGDWITYDTWLADGISWAANNGAHVLSNSWGGGPDTAIIHNAIIDANQNGRGGLGSVVVFASGNFNTSVSYPAKYDEVIAVGASSPCDERKTPSSCDGENWGSNYGSELDVVAPGVKITTTDIMGSGGYSGHSDYITNFNGTSAAAPHVAGLAALILSVNPQLTSDEVKSIIYNSADDEVGPPSEDTPGWDQYMGWGRINAFEALRSICTSQGTMELGQSVYGSGAQISIEVKDTDLNSNPSQIEQYTTLMTISTDYGDLESSVVLTEINADSCLFTASLATEAAVSVPEDSTLQLACAVGETITAEYNDADDGTGNSAVVSTTATTDCDAPVISSISAQAGIVTATIEWTTDEPADSTVHYTSVLPVMTDASDFNLVTDHSVSLTGLTEDTLYYYWVESKDAAGNVTIYDNSGQYFEFTTLINQIVFVPDNYSTIQAAIDAILSYPQNEIIVRAGTYPENIDFKGKAFTLRSESGPEVTIINGINTLPVVEFVNIEGPDSVIEGFTIRNGLIGIKSISSSPTIRNNIITLNGILDPNHPLYNKPEDPNYLDRGGIDCNIHASPLITNSVITVNRGFGGIRLNDLSNPRIEDSIITENNSSGSGAGIHCFQSWPTIVNTIISNNTAEEYGGGFYGENLSWVDIINSTFRNNNAGLGGASLYGKWTSPIYVVNSIFREGSVGLDRVPNEFGVDSSSIYAQYSNIEGGWAGTGNIDADPLFLGPLDSHLGPNSPSVDTGTSDTVNYAYLPDLDLDGLLRPQGLSHDMGVYEYPCFDQDGDTACDYYDNCLILPNPDQTDTDSDGVGDVCDVCPLDNPNDSDNDGICEGVDICPGGDDTIDTDGDGVPDFCDACPLDNPDDTDNDGICNGVDTDIDGDGIDNALDNCEFNFNPEQIDLNGNGEGSACDSGEPLVNFGSVNDAPHNESFGITCSSCHTHSLWFQYKPVPKTDSSFIDRVNFLCSRCHGTGQAEVTMVTHSKSNMDPYGNAYISSWTNSCVDCHNPHHQLQLEHSVTNPEIFLAEGDLGAPSSFRVDSGNQTTSFDYTLTAASPNWSTPASWSKKNDSFPDRGLVLVSSRSGQEASFIVSGADASRITVNGYMDPLQGNTTFGLIYGQLLKHEITNPFAQKKTVKFFDPDNDWADNSASSEKICNVCHSDTIFYNLIGSGSLHQTGNCRTCHLPAQGFRPPAH